MASTLSPTHSPATPATTERERMLNSIFTTALEGGIGYWSQCSVYRWHVVGTDAVEAIDFLAVITETGDGDGTDEYVIDADVIRRGIRRMVQRGNWNTYITTALGDIIGRHYDDLDYDSDFADIAVQMGLFNEYRYS